MKFFFIMNPAACNGNSSNLFNEIFWYLSLFNVDYEYEITKDINHAFSLSAEANRAKYDVIVAVGGDGTINRVLNGFYKDNGLRASSAKMGVVYTGTSPDFCRSYNIPLNIVAAIKTLIKGNSRKIGIGRIMLARDSKKELNNRSIDSCTEILTQYFGCCVNIGLGPDIASFANSGIRKICGDVGGTFLALMRALFYYRPTRFTIYADGQKRLINRVYNLSIGRTFYIASGLKIRNELQNLPGDKHFYFLIIKNITPLGLWKILNIMYKGKKIFNNETIAIYYKRSIEVYGNNQYPRIEFDGDVIGYLPCKIEIASDPLDLITG